MIKLNKKYVFHIPQYKFENDKLIAIDTEKLIEEFISTLNENGYTSTYLSDVKSYYKNKSYTETLITLFTTQENEPEKLFRQFFHKNNSILKQEAFAYECEDKMFIEDLDD
ncbi:MAG: hypothetical protein IJQ68_01695 [Methanobrevibacter sp.]|uniref:hypothetical protein n=1 Tax=Methanobrevibacter sp. TaxID=66852 RepID=UPI0025E1F762|nr:hypothetical protein [Methanobrevibacter sp.]MBR0270694.1 hypothetical protein [Methanobrevibacter sp.]